MFSRSALIAIAAALQVSAGALRAQDRMPMPVAKADSGRFAEMKVAPRKVSPDDSEPSSPRAVNGRLIGCTNPLADGPR